MGIPKIVLFFFYFSFFFSVVIPWKLVTFSIARVKNIWKYLKNDRSWYNNANFTNRFTFVIQKQTNKQTKDFAFLEVFKVFYRQNLRLGIIPKYSTIFLSSLGILLISRMGQCYKFRINWFIKEASRSLWPSRWLRQRARSARHNFSLTG